MLDDLVRQSREGPPPLPARQGPADRRPGRSKRANPSPRRVPHGQGREDRQRHLVTRREFESPTALNPIHNANLVVGTRKIGMISSRPVHPPLLPPLDGIRLLFTSATAQDAHILTKGPHGTFPDFFPSGARSLPPLSPPSPPAPILRVGPAGHPPGPPPLFAGRRGGPPPPRERPRHPPSSPPPPPPHLPHPFLNKKPPGKPPPPASPNNPHPPPTPGNFSLKKEAHTSHIPSDPKGTQTISSSPRARIPPRRSSINGHREQHKPATRATRHTRRFPPTLPPPLRTQP